MKQLSASDALTLSLAEKIQLVEDIWDSIAIESDTVELSNGEKLLIDERLDAYRRNPGEGATWDEVRQRVQSCRR